jgi:MFS family permease
VTITTQQATRRYVGLTALRWLPVGITLPVTVLLALSRGLTLAEVGAVFVVHSVTVVLLELPTGGLADALGRRPVLVVSGLLHVGSCAAYATADGVPGFVLATFLLGAGRALDSGPLQAWYVDAVHLADPRADVTPGLSRAGAADCLALSVGAVLGGVTPALLDGSPESVLVLPFVAAAGLSLVSVAAVLLLVTPTGPARNGSAWASLLGGLRAVPSTVRSTVQLASGDDALRRVMLLSLVCGLALGTLELLGPTLFADLSGSATGGSAVFGVVMAGSFLAGAVGSALAPRSRRLARGSTPYAVAGLTLLSGLCLAGVAGTRTVLLAAVAYAGFYLANAASWPLLHAVLHARVGAGGRATALSASSLSLMVGGGTADLLNPRLVALAGRPAAYATAGGVLVLAALLALRLPASRDQEALLDEALDDGDDLLGGLVAADARGGGEHVEQLPQPAAPVTAREQGRAVHVDPT